MKINLSGNNALVLHKDTVLMTQETANQKRIKHIVTVCERRRPEETIFHLFSHILAELCEATQVKDLNFVQIK